MADAAPRYCDWRYSISDCEEEEFFFRVQAYATACCAFQTVSIFISLNLKLFGIKEPLSAFKTGANGALVVFFFAMLMWLIQGLVVLLADHPLAGQILWAIIIPLPLFPVVVFLATLLETFPEIFVTKEHGPIQVLISSARLRRTIMWVFVIFLFFLNVILHVVSTQLTVRGMVEEAARVEQAAEILLAVNILLFLVLFVYVSLLFTKVINDCMRALNPNQMMTMDADSREKTEIMVMVTKKIRSNMVASVIDSLLLVIYHLLLAFYPSFFSNLPFSKAMTVVVTAILPSVTLPLMFVYFYVDIKRIIHRINGSTRLSSDKLKSLEAKETKPIMMEEGGKVVVSPTMSDLSSEEALDSYLREKGTLGS